MALRRRDLFGLSLAIFSARLAGQASKVYRIGWLSASTVDGPVWDAFVEGMRERGWIEGKNLAFDRLISGGRNERFPELVAELVQRNVDVIVTAGTPPAIAARDGTSTSPIVFYFAGDPVGSGLVDSLARPGRNLTGLGGLGTEAYAKQLEVLKEVVPKASRIALFVNDGFAVHAAARDEVESAARRLAVTLIPIQVRSPQDLDGAFATVARERIDALHILGQPFMVPERIRIARLAIEQRTPAMTPFEAVTEAGALVSYAPRIIDDLRRLPYYVDRIFKGAKPAELPVEQPTRFYLSINLKTAALIGLAVPPAVLARADQVFR